MTRGVVGKLEGTTDMPYTKPCTACVLLAVLLFAACSIWCAGSVAEELSPAGLLERDTGIGSATDITSVVVRLRTGEAYMVTRDKASRLIRLVYRTLAELYPLTSPPIDDWDILLISTEQCTYWLTAVGAKQHHHVIW